MVRASLKTLALGLLVAGFTPAMAAQPAPTTAAKPAAATTDVQLVNGVLSGRVVDSQGQPVQTTVTVHRDGKAVQQVKTDVAGTYNVQGLNSGMYVVSTPQGAGVVRAWEAGAPPQAVKSLAIVEGQVVRGQLGGALGGGLGGAAASSAVAIGVSTGVAVGINNETQDDLDAANSRVRELTNELESQLGFVSP